MDMKQRPKHSKYGNKALQFIKIEKNASINSSKNA